MRCESVDAGATTRRRHLSVLTLAALVAGAVLTLVVPGGPASAALDANCSAGGYEKVATGTNAAWPGNGTWIEAVGVPNGAPASTHDLCVPTGVSVTIGNNDTAVAKSVNGGGTITFAGNTGTSFTLGNNTDSAESWIGTFTLQTTGSVNATGFAGTATLNVGTLNWNHIIPFTGTAPVVVTGTMNAAGSGPNPTTRPITIASGATATFDGPRINFNGDAADLTNNGTVNYSADTLDFQNSADIVNNGVFDLRGPVVMLRSLGSGQTFTNSATGTIRRSTAAGIAVVPLPVTSAGTVDIQTGSIEFSGGFTNQNTGAGFTLGSGDAVTITNNSSYVNQGVVDVQAGGSLTFTGTGSYTQAAGAITTVGGTLTTGTGGYSQTAANGLTTILQGGTLSTGGGNYTQSASTTRTTVDGSLNAAGATVALNAGLLEGDGSITAANVNNTGTGTVKPGETAPKSLGITGNYAQGTSAKVRFTTYSGGTHDALNVSGNATLDGKLSTVTDAGYDPALGTTFPVITTGGTTSGAFSAYDVLISGGDGGKVYDPSITAGGVTLTVAAVPTLDIGDVIVDEGDGTATFTVTRSGTAGVPVSARYATSPLGPNSATANVDYTTTTGTLTIAAGATTTSVVVPIADDAFGELNETFQVKLSKPGNAGISDAQGVGTITDDDGPAPSFSVTSVSQAEGSDGAYSLPVTINREGETGETVSVRVALANGTAKSTTGDFTAQPSQVVTFAPGVTTQVVNVTVEGDTTPEGDEYFKVNLSKPVGGTVASNGTVTLENDD